jgi:NAD(P)-dependent dehydrogenase (short-subunit alcohol dehydrogenase family)
MQDLRGKVAVITGAASGIGRGMAEAFIDAGMKVVLSDIEAPALEATTEALRAAGGDVHGVLADVSKPDQVEGLAQATLSKYGAVHVLCNNAGVGVRSAASWDNTLDDWNWILGVNLMGVVYGQRTFLPIMLRQGTEAHIVNTASVTALISGEGTLYATTKAAVLMLSETTYLELQRRAPKVRVSVLCPGFVDTNIMGSQRNRPAEFGDMPEVDSSVLADVYREWFAAQLKRGLSPRAVGDQVLKAIRAEQFYILTHPDWNYLIEQRMRRMLSGENPTAAHGPGFDEFVRMLGERVKPSS